MKGSVKLPVFIDDARKYVNTTQLRAKYLGASYEAEYCQWQTLHGLGSLMETASLIITPNAYLEGKLIASYPPDPIGDFDVTRATTATRVNSAGLVELVPYNQVQYSEQFNNAIWLKDLAVITPNTTTAPDGTLTADTFETAQNKLLWQQQLPTAIGATYTASFYVKLGTATNVCLIINNTAAWNTIGGESFDSSDGLNTTTWTRVSYTFTSPSSVINFHIGGNSETGLTQSSGTLFIWGAQLVEGSAAKDYQKTETRLNIPRLDYSNGTCPSLLVEPQRTNLLTYSSSFDNAAWLLYQSSITANSTISPSGVQDADTMVATLNSTGVVYRSALTGANTSTFSFYIKAGTSSSLQYGVADGGTDYDVFVNLSTGTITSITSGITATITELENGWYRCSLTRAMTGNGTIYVNNLATTAGQTMFIWGAQLEAGSYATSYIPTTSASVTRNVDLVAKTGISSLIGQTEGTCFIDFNYDNSTAQGNPLLFSFRNTAWTNEVYAQILASGGIQVQTYLGGAQQSYLYYGGATNGHHKIAYAYKQNDFILYVDGVQVATDTSGNVPTTDDFCLGYFNTSFTPTANYNAAALWKTRLTNTQLQTLTSL